ncbi:putative UDP-glucosyltransferase [Corchorus olitorius]|uniref:UDP-glucosyltransferase n=1 Tax=Corchorus olitorius TaxID=93759 RepID=A0A1R3FWP4_9ROSI|nr:putative UDP-glucosyltransferase [Corchorus olitorius]
MKYQVVFISTPAMGNQVPTLEFAHHLTHRDPRFLATVLIITLHQRTIVNAYIRSRSSSATYNDRIKFIYLPTVDPPTPDQYQSSLGYFSRLLDKQKPHVKQAISNLMSTSPPPSFDNQTTLPSSPCIPTVDATKLQLCSTQPPISESVLGFLRIWPKIVESRLNSLCSIAIDLQIKPSDGFEFQVPLPFGNGIDELAGSVLDDGSMSLKHNGIDHDAMKRAKPSRPLKEEPLESQQLYFSNPFSVVEDDKNGKGNGLANEQVRGYVVNFPFN